jgi:hypothetical protein
MRRAHDRSGRLRPRRRWGRPSGGVAERSEHHHATRRRSTAGAQRDPAGGEPERHGREPRRRRGAQPPPARRRADASPRPDRWPGRADRPRLTPHERIGEALADDGVQRASRCARVAQSPSCAAWRRGSSSVERQRLDASRGEASATTPLSREGRVGLPERSGRARARGRLAIRVTRRADPPASTSTVSRTRATPASASSSATARRSMAGSSCHGSSCGSSKRRSRRSWAGAVQTGTQASRGPCR